MIGATCPGWVWPLLAAPVAGSFVGVLIQRLPASAPVVFARSACCRCGTRLSGWELIPLVSFIALRGRCRHCRQPISLLHPLVELAALIIAAWGVWADPDPSRIWFDCALGWTLLALGWIDCASLLLPDVLTLPLLLAGLAVTAIRQPDDLTDRCVAAALAYLSFQALSISYRRLRGRDGLGGGDAKLIAAAGAWCGLAPLPFIVLASAVAGLLVALGMRLAGLPVSSKTQIPLGACIALAFWLAWLHADAVDALTAVLGGS